MGPQIKKIGADFLGRIFADERGIFSWWSVGLLLWVWGSLPEGA